MAIEYDIKKIQLRDAINDRLSRLGISKWRLAHSGFVSSSPSTTFRFLNGECDTMASNVEEIMQALGLRVVADDGLPPWADGVRTHARPGTKPRARRRGVKQV